LLIGEQFNFLTVNILLIYLCVESDSDVSISLCPTDVVATVGATIVLRAAQPNSKVMRWYRKDTNTPPKKTCIYTGMEIDYKQVDYR